MCVNCNALHRPTSIRHGVVVDLHCIGILRTSAVQQFYVVNSDVAVITISHRSCNVYGVLHVNGHIQLGLYPFLALS